ncbi:AraC family transcriptional regulator ligand-binding domain-containing protein [Nocardia sp. NPDC051030]|uniref:AraC family transcriptional regulator ligand-binding domain-containing protein n=1 Tax=Nocardia sp. NPDC051030 TaxID=3155162 RepID=UPI003439A203
MSARPAGTDSILMPRFVLNRAIGAGLDSERLARLAGVPGWAEGGEATRVSSRYCLRLWELLEDETGEAAVALRAADDSTVGELGLLEYLVLSEPTLGAAFSVCVHRTGALTTSYSLVIGDRTDREVTYELRTAVEDSRGRELLTHSAFAFMIGRARWATRCQVDPLRVTFREPEPRSRVAFEELFGTATVDFGTAADTITLRARDLELPMKTADPGLAAVLRGYAASMPEPAQFAATWIDRVAAVLDAALHEGVATLDVVARRLLISPRSLQRRLAESGTSWRRELDGARRRRLERAVHLPRARQAQYLGYADPASLRRAVQRWQERDDG